MAVYFALNPATQLVKIGFTKGCPWRRVIAVESTLKPKATLKLISLYPDGDRALERQFHRKFAELCRRGEWFSFCDEMKGNTLIPPRPDHPHQRIKVQSPAHDALVAAINYAGSQDKLAASIGVWGSQISYWLHSKKGTPAEFCAPIERVTEGKITARQLRPDIF